MKPSEMRQLPVDELQHKHDSMLEDYFKLRIKHALGQLENPLVLRTLRRDIARAKTLLVERGVQEKSRRRRRTTGAAGTAVKAAGGRDKVRTAAKLEKVEAAEEA